MKPYKDGVTLNDIIIDGWSRGFFHCQTIDEARIMGYEIDEDSLRDKWLTLDSQYEAKQRLNLEEE